MEKRSVHSNKSYINNYNNKLKNRILAVLVFSIIVFGVILDLESRGIGKVVSIAETSRVKVDSYAPPATAFAGENVVVDVYLKRPANSFDYGYLECDVKGWRGKNLGADKIVTYASRCVTLPESSSFTMQYRFKPLVKGYYRVGYCKIITAAYPKCTGSKWVDLKRDVKGVNVVLR